MWIGSYIRLFTYPIRTPPPLNVNLAFSHICKESKASTPSANDQPQRCFEKHYDCSPATDHSDEQTRASKHQLFFPYPYSQRRSFNFNHWPPRKLLSAKSAWWTLEFHSISPLYKLIWPLHVRIRGNWAESVSTLLKNGAIVRSLGDTGTKMAPSLCWDFKLSNEGPFVEIGQEMTKLGWKFGRKAFSPCRRSFSPCGRSQLQFVCSDGAFIVVLCPGKPPSTGPKWKFMLSLEFLRTQQWGLGLDFKSSGPNPIYHDFSCGPYLQLRIAVVESDGAVTAATPPDIQLDLTSSLFAHRESMTSTTLACDMASKVKLASRMRTA